MLTSRRAVTGQSATNMTDSYFLTTLFIGICFVWLMLPKDD